jgi:hypothetical protein
MIPARRISSLLVVVLTLLLAACGQSQSATSAPQALAVAAKEFAFVPAALSVQAGQPVTVSLRLRSAAKPNPAVMLLPII